jgi:hypothetical protein
MQIKVNEDLYKYLAEAKEIFSKLKLDHLVAKTEKQMGFSLLNKYEFYNGSKNNLV